MLVEGCHVPTSPPIHLPTASPLEGCRAPTTQNGQIGQNAAEVKGSDRKALHTVMGNIPRLALMLYWSASGVT